MAISDKFHIFYDKHRLWEDTSWLGIPIQKLPMDLLIFQEIICDVRPDFIIDVGSRFGGSALFFASILHLLGLENSKVLTIDIQPCLNFAKIQNKVLADKVIQIFGGSTNALTVEKVKAILNAKVKPKIIGFLDSWHSSDHVLRELEIYSEFVSVGSYIIAEDTHINNPVHWEYDDLGPAEAVRLFLEKTDNFVVDESREKLIFTFNPGGFIKRIR